MKRLKVLAARAEGQHFGSDDLCAEVPASVGIFPATRMQATFDVNLLPAHEMLAADFSKRAPCDHVEVSGDVACRAI